MASGWAPDGAVQEQIDDSIEDEIRRARALLRAGEGAGFCTECGEAIPPARREAMPGARTCIACQSERDRQVDRGLYNRRGSKDSQLR